MKTWHEKNQTNYYCDYCQQFVRNNDSERKKHEASPKHKNSVLNFHKNKNQVKRVKREEQEPVKVVLNPNMTKEQQKKAIQKQEQFDRYYSNSSKTYSTSHLPNIDKLQETNEQEDEEEEEIKTEIEEIKKKKEELEDDYYDNPDFFYSNDSNETEALEKKEEEKKNELKLKKQQKEEEEKERAKKMQRIIEEQEYLKKTDQKTGLGGWEDVEEVEIEQVKVEETIIKKEENVFVQNNYEENVKKLVGNEDEENEKVKLTNYNYSETSQAKKRKLDKLKGLFDD